MGSTPCPQVQTLPLFGEPEPNENTQAIWGANPKPPISPMACIWELPKPQGVYGEHPMPPMSDAAAIRGLRTQREDASYLGSQPQAPSISDGVYLGVAQAPRCIWGVPHAPNVRHCRYSGSPNPTRRRKLFGEPTPSPQYLRWRVFGRCPSPKVNMGSAPCPRYNFSFLILHFSLFTFHFSLFISTSHDTEL